jgi:hypothetical protein
MQSGLSKGTLLAGILPDTCILAYALLGYTVSARACKPGLNNRYLIPGY